MAATTNDGVPDAVKPPPGHRRFPLIDGLRAIAVIAIVAFHTPGRMTELLERIWLHLNIGVTIFFVISGFLLYRPFVAHRVGGAAAPAALAYAKRRLLRLLPAYWLCVTVLLIAGGIAVGPGQVVAQYALAQTLPFAGEGSCINRPIDCELAQTWSLGIEATFYLALPLYVVLAERLAAGRPTGDWVRNELLLLGLLSIAGMVGRFVLFSNASTSAMTGTAIGWALWFSLGMGLAVLSVDREAGTGGRRLARTVHKHPSLTWIAAAAAFAALCALLPLNPFAGGTADQVLAFVGYGLVSTLIVLPAIFADERESIPRKVLANPVMSWLGLVSYGIFLWHYAVLIELARQLGPSPFLPLFGLALVTTSVIAAASYYLLERPFLRLKHRGNAQRARERILAAR